MPCKRCPPQRGRTGVNSLLVAAEMYGQGYNFVQMFEHFYLDSFLKHWRFSLLKLKKSAHMFPKENEIIDLQSVHNYPGKNLITCCASLSCPSQSQAV